MSTRLVLAKGDNPRPRLRTACLSLIVALPLACATLLLGITVVRSLPSLAAQGTLQDKPACRTKPATPAFKAPGLSL